MEIWKMRIIKFRLIKNNKIVGYENHVIDESIGVGIGIYHNPIGSKLKAGYPITGGDKWFIFHDIKCQYIGLKDKEGNELCEGDIIKCDDWYQSNGEFVEIKYGSEGSAEFEPMGSNDFSVPCDGCVRVGNIYENKELLKKEK